MVLVLLCTMVRAKRRVGPVLFMPRKVATRLLERVAVVEVARLKESKTCKLEVKKNLVKVSGDRLQ